ncbi:MarR family winged helix-turn-helix transcriptional regulator [Arsukibacterium indicum]|uniref:MarR family winged helix-turn-helix transcriptional regulator n=1 Tax=Arsukibacterium indicum TaxID=2848612 RepID=A0ABS6MP14_9GAMM|nr:MarR family winged helix-turn-helix transcriptional regulator [Arsukibacterium indicum]MBV2130480.1 MarR family winged helix-turn-helix transcriptional regulator [Arsukibacterium indicum]
MQTRQTVTQKRKSIVSRMRSILEKLHASSRKTYKTLGFDDLNPHWFQPLTLLDTYGPLGVKQIAEGVNLSLPTVSQALKSLESSGLIEFRKDTDDGRRRVVFLTPHGRKMVDDLKSVWDAFEKVAYDLDKESEGILKHLDMLDEAISRRSVFDRVLHYYEKEGSFKKEPKQSDM